MCTWIMSRQHSFQCPLFVVLIAPNTPPRDGRAGQTALVAELRGVRWSTNGQAISGHQLEPAIILTQIFTRIPPTNYKTILEGEDNGLDNLKCSYSMVSNVVMYMHLKD